MPNEETLSVTKVEHVTITTKVIQDEYCENPVESCDGMGTLKLFQPRNFSQQEYIHETYKDDPMALPLEAYIHGGTIYALQREGNFPDRQWDVATLAGYWVCDGYALENYQSQIRDKTPEEACEILKEYARGVLKEYNAWLAGDCWGISTTYVQDDGTSFVEEDTVWGIIGIDDAKKEAGLQHKTGVDYVEGCLAEKKKIRE